MDERRLPELERRRFTTAIQAAGIDLARPYDLRHYAASLWIAEGRNVVEVAAWLGHDPTMTLKTYAHVVADRDPNDRRTFDDRVMAARRDMSVTYERVKAGQPTGKRKTRKRRKKVVSGVRLDSRRHPGFRVRKGSSVRVR